MDEPFAYAPMVDGHCYGNVIVFLSRVLGEKLNMAVVMEMATVLGLRIEI